MYSLYFPSGNNIPSAETDSSYSSLKMGGLERETGFEPATSTLASGLLVLSSKFNSLRQLYFPSDLD